MRQFLNRTAFFASIIGSALVHSGNAKTVDTVAVEGLSTTAQVPMVRAHAGIHAGDEFNSASIQEAVKRLYYLGLFKSIDMYATKETDSAVSLMIKVVEFPVIEAIEYSGFKKIGKEDIEKAVTLKKGQALSDAAVFENIAALKKLYADKGFLLADIKLDTMRTKVPGMVLAKFKIKEGSKVEVKQIFFKGVTAFKESKLKHKFKTKEKKFLVGGDYDEEKYRAHLDTLIMFYNDEGFLDAEIAGDSVWYGDNKKDIYISITINEGKKYYAGDMYFAGNTVLESDALKSQNAMKRGKPFNKSRYEITRQALEARYREEGYLWVQMSPQRAYRGDTIDVTFQITEGRPAVVRKIDIVGNTKTRDNVIRREITLMPGRKYKQSFMMESVRRLMQLGFFSNAEPNMRPNDDGTVDFIFTVIEKENMGQFQLGAAFSPVQKFTLTSSVSIPNFRGSGEQLDLNLQLGVWTQDISVGFMEPWAFNTPTSLRGDIFFTRNIYESTRDTTLSYGFTSSIWRDLKWPDDKFSASGSYRISREEIYGSSDTLAKSPGLVVLRKGILSRMTLGIKRNDTDKRMFPTSGSIFDVSTEFTGLGGDFKYIKGIVSIENYYPLFWKFVFGPRVKIGTIQPLVSGPVQISYLNLFSAGGSWPGLDAIVRGYDDLANGGITSYVPYNQRLALLSMNAEIRLPVLEDQLYFSVFGDMGNTWARLVDIDMLDMYKGVGAGFRLNIPMLGLLGLDFGWGLDDPERKDRHFNNRFRPHINTHIVVGKGF